MEFLLLITILLPLAGMAVIWASAEGGQQSARLIALATAIATLLVLLFPPREQAGRRLPPAFAATTALLIFVSAALVRAVQCVRRERQRPFRRSLAAALAAGTLFVGVQGFALLCLLASRTSVDAQTGALASGVPDRTGWAYRSRRCAKRSATRSGLIERSPGGPLHCIPNDRP